MTEKEANTLKVGDRVQWSGDGDPHGTVTKTAHKYLEIVWDDSSAISALHPADCFRVFRSR